MSDRAGHVLAVDGGNSKTIALIADLDGRILGAARGGATDIYAQGSALARLSEIAGSALSEARVAARDLAASVLSLAGADWPEDFELIARESAERLGLARPPTVVNDAFGGLRSGAPDNVGIAVVCGTFNAIGARQRDGRIFHLGFWPDRVGGFDLGIEALNAVTRAGLELGPPTRLSERALALFGAGDALALLHAFTRREGRRPLADAQQLTPILLDLAHAGDAVALAIVRGAGSKLGEQARISAARVGLALAEAKVVLTGSVLQHPSPELGDAVMARLPGARAVRTSVPPVVGALLLALDEVGSRVRAEEIAAQLAARSLR